MKFVSLTKVKKWHRKSFKNPFVAIQLAEHLMQTLWSVKGFFVGLGQTDTLLVLSARPERGVVN